MVLNPADPDYQIQVLLQLIRELTARMDRVEADTHSPSAPPPTGVTESIEVDPTNPHLYIYTSASIDPTAHTFVVPVSTLIVPNTSNPSIYDLPTLSTP